MSTLLDTLTTEIERLLDPLVAAAEDPYLLEKLLALLGATTGSAVTDAERAALASVFGAVAELQRSIEELANESSPSLQSISSALDVFRSAFELLRAIPDLGSAAGAFADLGEDLASYVVSTYLRRWHPVAHRLAVLATLIEPAEELDGRPPVVQDDELIRGLVRLDQFRLERLVALLRDPQATLSEAYGSSLETVQDAEALAGKLFSRLLLLLKALRVPCRLGIGADDVAGFGDAAALVKNALIIYADDPLAGASAEAGVVLNLSSADRGDLGLVVSPFGTLARTEQVGDWSVELDVSAAVDVVAYGRHGLTLLADAATTEVTGGIRATLPAPQEGPAFILGSPTGSRLEVGGAKLALETQLSQDRSSLALSADVSRAAIVIEPSDADGFLGSLLPDDGMRAEFDLGLGWSNDRGLTLRGSAGLEASIPLGVSAFGISLSSLYLGLRAHDERVTAEVSGTLSASIGPVSAVLDRVGLAADLTFPEDGGNLGVADLAIGFKPPSGIGLSVDAQGVLTGGGFLFHDAAQHLYAGALQVSLRQVTLKSFGLIATRMPDGSRGYSLLIFITAEDFRPIPLGLGFMLQGIGGMVAVHRSFDQNVLREGLKSGTLGTLLFPRDLVTNAPAIVRSLASAFPARRGSYLMGLLVRIGWLTPALIQMDLALILEFGARRRLLVLGRISSLLPSRENDLIRLNLDAIGVLDFDDGSAEIDAVLVDSRLAHKFALTGAMALRARLGSGAGFVLAVGGLNPHFAAPLALPKLDRVAIALSSGTNPRLTCEAYLAITSNTLQFGSRAQLYAEAYGFSVLGDVGFDVLLERVPLHFLADFYASMQLKRGSRNLFKVALEGQLEGPRPLRVSGKASFEILWCDFSIRFDKTLVSGEKPPLPTAVDVLVELKRALSSPESWSTRAPEHQAHGVALRRLAPGPTFVLDPLGQLVVKQQVVPLNTGRDVELFGGAPVSGTRRFAVSATLGGQPAQVRNVREAFAPAQYFRMSDDEKLAAPSFEQMDAGLELGSDAVSFDATQIVAGTLRYKSIVIDADGTRAPTPAPYALPATQLETRASTGSVARAALRRTGTARFRNTEVAPAIQMRAPAWKITPLGEGNAMAMASEVRTWTEHRAALEKLNRGSARFQLVPTHELVA